MSLHPLRLAVAPVLAVPLLVLTAGTALGHYESFDQPAAAKSQTLTVYDISYPQCGGRYPTAVDYGIVGVNRGIAFRPNPCLGAGGTGASQLAWAGLEAGFYMNTGNPGPQLSTHWPTGQSAPRPCSVDDPDTADCAYDYGWNAAKDAYATALAAYVSLGWADRFAARTPVANAWWLDVETANSWRDDTALNVASLQGSVAYLESVEVGSVGFYSANSMWQSITGGTNAFTDYSSWVAGAPTVRDARQRCQQPAFTGGAVELTQYLAKGFDADYRCAA